MREKSELYFEDPLLKLSVGTRLWAKSLRGVLHTVAFVGGGLMIFSDIASIFSLGMLLLGYTAFRIGRSRRWWSKGHIFRGGNLYPFMQAESKELLEAASDRAVIVGGSFLLNLMRELTDTAEVEEVLKRLGIRRDEFAGQIDKYLQEERKLKETKAWRAARAEEAVVKAFTTQSGSKKPITPKDLFKALRYTENERVQRVFNLFGVTPEGIEGKAGYNLENAG
ncbi:MAG: hypothetical protein U1C52_01615 [Patescibacteria group bacterium]|nr:hypothetical protein [Patescibacteria group bacterium]